MIDTGWMTRRGMLRGATSTAAGLAVSGWALARASSELDSGNSFTWPAWNVFVSRFVSPSGRVIVDQQGQTHSEAQSYALLFALAANERERFERLLRWTEDNLCAGDIGARLPAWLWGKREDDTWGVIDANAASDADLWIAYALAEAGRLWDNRRYRELSMALAQRIVREETADLQGLGLTLLPGPHGFALADGRWRLNPSYTPLQVLHRLAESSGELAYKVIAANALRVMVESAPNGFSPDWTIYDSSVGHQNFYLDTEGKQKGQGAYNAIRVYLWAGMLDADVKERKPLLKALAPMARFVRERGYPPESIDILTGQASGPAPLGFSAALLPFLQASGQTDALQAQQLRLAGSAQSPSAYYEQCLMLFGQGWMQSVYRFDRDGLLLPRWSQA